jgi:formate dehydrogenase major subunit
VQGASDAGLIPMMLPDYQPVDAPQVRERFERLGAPRSTRQAGPDRGRDHARHHAGQIKGMYIRARTRRCPTPTLNHAREALATLRHLVVQDIFLTETAYWPT